VLMTVATWVPEDYSLARFHASKLGYGLHQMPLELWGDPQHVQHAVATHNAVVRRVAQESQGVRFVDQARLLAGRPGWFNDPCHLSVRGPHRFVHNLLPAVLPAIRAHRDGTAALVSEHTR